MLYIRMHTFLWVNISIFLCCVFNQGHYMKRSAKLRISLITTFILMGCSGGSEKSIRLPEKLVESDTSKIQKRPKVQE